MPNLTIKQPIMKLIQVLTELPKGWVVVENTNTQPIGFVFVSNNKSRFGTERKLALLKIK